MVCLTKFKYSIKFDGRINKCSHEIFSIAWFYPLQNTSCNAFQWVGQNCEMAQVVLVFESSFWRNKSTKTIAAYFNRGQWCWAYLKLSTCHGAGWFLSVTMVPYKLTSASNEKYVWIGRSNFTKLGICLIPSPRQARKSLGAFWLKSELWWTNIIHAAWEPPF